MPKMRFLRNSSFFEIGTNNKRKQTIHRFLCCIVTSCAGLQLIYINVQNKANWAKTQWHMQLFYQVEIVFILLLSAAINTYSFMSVSGTMQQELEAFVDMPQKVAVLSVTALFNQKFERTLYKSNSISKVIQVLNMFE